ncbi:putative dynamin-related protein 4A [Spatholobus suberectus]|nr:putative dynamin-related protein 4A [Spatholobus suberectus]
MKMARRNKTTHTTITITQRDNDPTTLVHAEKPHPLAIIALIVSSYNKRIRPILDAIENLKNLNIIKEGIKLCTIVVVGDQSSGKFGVLESLVEELVGYGKGISNNHLTLLVKKNGVLDLTADYC